MKNKNFILFLTLSFSITATNAEVKPNSLFSDHMVLQRNVAVPVWGTAADGEKVTVSFNGQTVSTTAANGRWMIKLEKLKAGGPYTMTVAGTNTISINDVLVGEVWLCSGQSNMERQLGPRPPQQPIAGWEKEVSEANYPQIRQYFVPEKYTPTPLTDIGSKWETCSPETVKNFSAVGYFFARDLYKEVNVPVGILFSAYGGTPAEHWTSKAALEADPELKNLVDDYLKAVKGYPMALNKYKENEKMFLIKFREDSAKAAEENKPIPKKPMPPSDPVTSRSIGTLYNAMIAPMIPYAIKGICWYQGEANNGRTKQYVPLLSAMISSWRKDFEQGDVPFLIVQIAPYKDMSPEIREAQLIITQKVDNTALIVTTDVGDSADIHPPHKKEVGARLAIAAEALAYGKKIEYSGPVYQSIKIENDKAELSFTHTGKGLVSKDGELKGFTIAGADSVFMPASATIKGNKVIVSNSMIAKPVSVRYGWSNVPNVNLYNKEGLPATPFRTDK